MGLPCWRLEDGFLRSIGLGNQDPPLSLVVDDIGIYYDASRPSRLESLINHPLSINEMARAQALMTAWRTGRVSKYNYLREFAFGSSGTRHLLDSSKRYVLAVDQTFGDASIRYGSACPGSFNRMLQAALEENPGCTVLVKIHPDVFAGRKSGHFNLADLSRMERVCLLGEDVHPVGLIEHAEAVYAVSSQLGFEGLLWGKPVRTFGMPFYAGWGLTQDELPAPQRRKPVKLENLVHAALAAYPRYIDPETGKRCEVERLLGWMALQRRMQERFPAIVYAFGFSPWKRPLVRSFLRGSRVRFVYRLSRVPPQASLVVWGSHKVLIRNGDSKPQKRISQKMTVPNPATRYLKMLRLEDGFLRSVGLGSDLVRPLSWVVDGRGLYYDSTCPSDLEHLLQNAAFDEALLNRARELMRRIAAQGITKYNVSSARWSPPDYLKTREPLLHGGEGAGRVGPGRRIIMVPGQVESDASIRFGAPQIRSNIELLRAVRDANSEAYLVYKPHPDVIAGLRKKGKEENDAHRWCDETVANVNMGALLNTVDEVHVLTSLAGFEALLRGKRVVTYGQPFYSGWGLTKDHTPTSRRTRKLSIEELVAGVMILYPTYVSLTTRRFTTPERALEELLAWREACGTELPWWRKCIRWFLRFGKR
jgi:capsular polysaccharide export protein